MQTATCISTALFFVAITAIRTDTCAQGVVRGRVTGNRGQVVPMATVRLKKAADSSTSFTAVADTGGVFRFFRVPAGAYEIEASATGFLPFHRAGLVVGSSTSSIDLGVVPLVPKTTQLETLVINGQPPIIDHQIDRIVLHVDQKVSAAGTNVLDLIRQFPGVQVTSDGQITLNGRSGVTVLIDGKPTYLSAEDLAAQLTGMSSATIQTVEVMTNPSAKYDAEGTGGIINIVRKRNRAPGLNGTASGTLSQGNYPGDNFAVLLSYKTARYNLYVNNSYYFGKSLHGFTSTANILNGTNLQTREATTSSGATANWAGNTTAGIDWYLSKATTLTLSGNGTARQYDDRTNALLDLYDSTLVKSGIESFTTTNKDRPRSYTAGLRLSHRLDTSGREWSVDADYSMFHYRPLQYITTVYDDTSGHFQDQQDVFLDQTRTLEIFGATADYVYPLPGKGKLEAGGKSSYVRTDNNSSYYNQAAGQAIIDSTQSDYNVNSENINAAYINVGRKYRKLSLQAGLRAEQTVMKGHQLYSNQAAVNQSYLQIFPSLFADYKLGTANSLNFQLGRRIDRADYHELVPFRRQSSPTLYFEGNPYLRPDLTWHGEVTWAWKQAVYFTVAYDIDKDYVRTLDYLDADDSSMTRIPTNIQGAHSWNADLSYNHRITKFWTGNTTLSLYRNAFSGSARGINLDNSGIVSLYLESDNSLALCKGLSGEVDFEFDSKRQFIHSEYGAYSILSFGLKHQIPGKKVTISLNAHNVLQSESRSGTENYPDFNQYSYGRIYTRVVSLTVAYRFGSGKVSQTRRSSGSEDEQQRAGN